MYQIKVNIITEFLTITDAVTFEYLILRCAYCMEQNRGNVSFDVKYMNIDERINI